MADTVQKTSQVTPKSRKAWRTWLEKNGTGKREIWLVFYKRHTGKPTLTYDDAVEEALCFGWIDGVKRSIDDERYMHRFSPRKPDSKWSETNKKRAARLRKAGLMTQAGQSLIDAAKRNGNWSASQRPRIDFDMPKEFVQRLRRNKKASAFFESLAPSYRRQYVAWIASAKREQTQDRRIAEALERLAAGQKLGMR